MKKLVLTFWVVLLTSTITVHSVANDSSLYAMYVETGFVGKKLVLNMNNIQAQVVKCAIFDENGTLIHKDQIDTSTEPAKRYDFGKLPNGRYTVIIDDLMKVEKLRFELNSNGIFLDQNHTEITYKPVVWLNADKTVDFNLLTLGKNAEVKLKKGDLVYYDEKFDHETSISKRFNLKELVSGKYSIVVHTNGETFFRYIYL